MNFFGQLSGFANLKQLVEFVVNNWLQFIAANFDFVRLIAQIFIGSVLTYALQAQLFKAPGSQANWAFIQRQIVACLTLK